MERQCLDSLTSIQNIKYTNSTMWIHWVQLWSQSIHFSFEIVNIKTYVMNIDILITICTSLSSIYLPGGIFQQGYQ